MKEYAVTKLQVVLTNMKAQFEGWEVEEDSTFGSIPNYGFRCPNGDHGVIPLKSREGFMSVPSLLEELAQHLPLHIEEE